MNKFKIAIRQFVPNFVSYFSAKYYLNWFMIGKVVARSGTQVFNKFVTVSCFVLRLSTVSALSCET